MKKVKYLLFLLVGLFVSPLLTHAGASLSVNKSTIENGSKVTASVTVSSTAAWNITISSAGATSGCTEKFVGDSGTGNNTTKTFSVTCKSTSTGIISFSMSGDITSSDGTNTKISGSKRVTVTVPREKSTNNELKSLSVEGYEISPAFSKDVKEYSVTVPSTVESINIIATKADSYASVEGAGEHALEAGANTFEVIVTSETGVSNTFTVIVNVEDLNPINVTIDKTKYTVVKEAKNLTKPELFDETTVKIGEYDIPAFTNAVSKYTLVGLKDEKGKISLFIYDKGKYTKYNEFLSFKSTISLLEMPKIPKGYTKEAIKINEISVLAYKTKNSNLYLVYGMNMLNGKKNYYTYDKEEGTFQLFDEDGLNSTLDTINLYKYISYGLGAGILLLLIVVILEAKNKKKIKVLEQKIIGEPKSQKDKEESNE